MKCTLILMAVMAVTELRCTNREADAERKFALMEANGIAKVKVDERGDVYLDSKLSSIDSVGDEFARLKS